MTTPPGPDPGTLETRVGRLENGHDQMTRKLDEILGIISGEKPGDPAPPGPGPGGRPGSVAEQVRAELARAEQEHARQKAENDQKTEQQTMAQRLAKLEEKKPEAPQPRRERLMFGKR